MIIVALMALPLIIFTVFLAIRPHYAKLSASVLRERLDQICQDVSRTPTFRAETITKFFTAMSTIDIPAGYVTAARLIAPVVPGGDTTTVENATCGTYTDNDGASQQRLCVFRPTVSGLGTMSADEKSRLGLAKYPAFGEDDCGLVDDNQCTAAPERNFFGPTSEQDDAPAGNTTVCEAVAELETPGLLGAFTGELERVTVRVAFWTPPNNWNPRLVPENEGNAPDPIDDWSRYSTKRSLTVVVAPHMITPPLDNARASAEAQQYMELNDLLLNAGTEGFGLVSDPSGTALSIADYFPNGFDNNQPARDTGFTANSTASGGGAVDNEIYLPPFPALSGDDLEERRTACMNLPTMVRNMFLASILKLAGRDGMHRLDTSVFLAGTQHRNLRDVDSYADGITADAVRSNNPPYFLNPPILMVAPGGGGVGNLFLDNKWIHPYITYYEGLRPVHLEPTATEPGYTNFKNSWGVPDVFLPAGIAGRSLGPSTALETYTTPAHRTTTQGWVLPFSRKFTTVPANLFQQYRPDLDYLYHDSSVTARVEEARRMNMVRYMRMTQLRDCYHAYRTGGAKINYDSKFLTQPSYPCRNGTDVTGETCPGAQYEPSEISNASTAEYVPGSAYAAGTRWDATCTSLEQSSACTSLTGG
jgi:hypothetical protein